VRQVVFRVRHPLAAIVTSALVIVCKPEMALAQVELEGVTILSTRSERDVYDIPANVTVIDRDELDKENVKDIDQLVRNVPGIIVSRQTSATDPFNTFGGFTIRGVGANRVQITVDGSRIAESIQDGTRDYISLDLVKSVDIVRGPASVLWGSDALGGLVAFETLDPEDILVPGSLMNGELKTSYDSENEAWKKTAIVAGSISPHVQFLAAYSTITANEVERSKARADGGIWGCPRNIDYGATPCNQLNPTDILSNNFLGKIVATPAPGHRVELTADSLDRKIEVDQRHDLGPEFSTITGLPTGVVNEDFQRVLDLQRQRYAVEHQWDVGNELFENIKWVLSYSPQDYAREGRRVRTLANGNRVVIEDTLDFSEQFTEADIQFVSPFEIAGLRHRFTYGFDGDITRTNYERRDVTTNLTTGAVTEARAGGFNFANAETTRADLFIQDEIKLFGDRLELIPGVRYATYKIVPHPDEDYQVVPGSEPKTTQSEALTAKIGATYSLTNHYAVYGQFAQGFKMPTAQQLYTSLPGDAFNLLPAPDLQPEKVNSYELGLRGKFDLSKFSVNVFYADYSDFIQSFYNPPGTDDFTYRNLSSVQLYGVEASGQTEIMPNLVAYGSLSYQFGNQTVEPGADEEAFNAAAPFNGIAGLIYKIPGYNLEFDLSSIFAADVTRQNSPTLFRPEGYVVFDLNTLWRPWHNIEITGSVLNIFDQRYFKGPLPYSFELDPSDSVARSNPLELQTQAGRTFRVGVAAKF
jgi:hemoglobin/transferrin/lactoferrin receptor protein